MCSNPPPAALLPRKTNPLVGFSVEELLANHRERNHDAISEKLLAVLDHLRETTYSELDPALSLILNSFAKHFFYFMTQEDFIPNDIDLAKFVRRNAVIANLAAMTVYRTTDDFVRILLGKPRSFTKLYALYGPRNNIQIDPKILFKTSPVLATKWFFACVENYPSDCAGKYTLVKLQHHIRNEEHLITGVLGVSHHTFFGATYIDHENDYHVKQRINQLFQATPLCQRQVLNAPKFRRIAVITSMWWPQQSVYRSQQPFIKALAHEHDLVLIHLGRPRNDLDRSVFSEVRTYDLARDPNDFSAVDPNDFSMAYFPDIGMSMESLVLSNMRIAPIQVSNYGHPVSTFGGRIDYWIGGQDVEDTEHAQKHYSERLVLIPGCGQAPVPIRHPLKYPALPDSPVLINCSWAGQKINHDHLQRLAEIARRVQMPVQFRFFPGGSILGNRLIPLRSSIEGVLGAEHVRVFGALNYTQYMNELEAAHFALDAHPFGGYNTAVDLLTLRKPIVTLEGNRFYNRSTAYLLRRVGLNELITQTPENYINVSVRMIEDLSFRERMMHRLKSVDLASTILSLEHVPAFVRAIDHLLENHETLSAQSGREPIIVE